MEQKIWHYTYYSYEQGGRGYIGKRTSRVPPEQDPYLGSFSDKSFKPTSKIIIATYKTAKEALRAESALQCLFKVHKSEHFANRAIYPFGKFGRPPSIEQNWDDPNKEKELQESARTLLKQEAATPKSELDAWLPLINLVRQEQQQIIADGRRNEMQILYLLKNPYGVTLPITNLENFCAKNRLDLSSIQKIFSGELESWKGWTRGKPVFPWID